MTTYSALVLASSPSAYYRFAENTGTTALDQTSNHYNGTYTGGFTLLQQNAIIADYADFAVLLNGTSGYVQCPSGLSTNGLAAFTVECWINATNNTFTNYAYLVANEDDPDTTHIGWYIRIAPSNVTPHVAGYFVVGNGVTAADRSWGSGVVTPGIWYHFAGVYDGANIYVYTNGYTDGRVTALTGNVGNATHNFRIGASPASSNYAPVTIDEVAIYPSALSASTILNHYQTGISGRSGITPFPNLVRRTGAFPNLTRRQS